ncbi:hypothetical protein Rs2_38774 [Raphanus sativus]|nr:hypothetical protein Rs2_38774 [Raphanus sativus]
MNSNSKKPVSGDLTAKKPNGKDVVPSEVSYDPKTNKPNSIRVPMTLLKLFLLPEEITMFNVQRSILGDWSRLDYGVELQVNLQDMLMLGTYYYQAESRIASLLAEDVSRYASDDDNSSRNSFPCRTG